MKPAIPVLLAAILVGCGSHAPTHSARAVESAFKAEHLRVSTVRTTPDVVLVSPKRGSDGASAFAVFVFPDVGSAENALQKQEASLRSSSEQWRLLTGRKVDLSRQTSRTDNVVVMFSSGVPQSLRNKVGSALGRLGNAA